MEDSYDRLVQYYLNKLQERYKKCTGRPEVIQALKMIPKADESTLKKVIEMLEVK